MKPQMHRMGREPVELSVSLLNVLQPSLAHSTLLHSC